MIKYNTTYKWSQINDREWRVRITTTHKSGGVLKAHHKYFKYAIDQLLAYATKQIIDEEE